MVFEPLGALDDNISGIGQDGFARSVVIGQRDNARLGVIGLEIDDVADVGTLETIDSLIVVPYHQNIRRITLGNVIG